MKKLLLFVLLIGFGLAALYSAGLGKWPTTHIPAEEHFDTVRVEPGPLVDVVEVSGPLSPREVSAVGCQVSGQVVKLYPAAALNEVVTEGQPLLELDSRVAKLKLGEAHNAVTMARNNIEKVRADLEAAQIFFNRQKDLLQKGVGVHAEADRAEHIANAAAAGLKAAQTQLRQAEEAERMAQLNLDLMTVRAPASGVIIEKKVVLGQLVAPPASAQLFTIASDLAKLKINAQIPESDIGRIQPGQAATFTLDAYSDSGKEFHGKVESVNPTPTSLQGAVYYNALIEVDNERASASEGGPESWMLRLGMTANVKIRVAQYADAWKLPAAAVALDLDEHWRTPQAKARLEEFARRPDHDRWRTVWVLRDNRPWPVFVRTGSKTLAEPGRTDDASYYRVLEWDPALQPAPNPKKADTDPEVIIGAPQPKSGMLDKVRIS